MANRTPQQPPQDVASPLVRWNDSVVDQERDCAGVVRKDPQRDIRAIACPVADTCTVLCDCKDRPDRVGIEGRIYALEENGHTLEAHAGVDRLGREISNDVVGLILDVLHENEVPELHEAFLVDDRAPIGSVLGSLVVEDLR